MRAARIVCPGDTVTARVRGRNVTGVVTHVHDDGSFRLDNRRLYRGDQAVKIHHPSTEE